MTFEVNLLILLGGDEPNNSTLEKVKHGYIRRQNRWKFYFEKYRA